MTDITIIGQTLIDDRYEILEPIGQGGQAVVAKALDRQTGNEVVIKQLSASPGDSGYDEAVARFKRAGEIRINHPNVVDPVDYAEEEGEHYIIMPYVEGDTLAQHLTKNGGKLPCDEACRIAHEIAKGLAAIHPGIVHRDLKPENIIIGDDGRVYIVDFGICKNSTQKTITTGDGILGSLPWMSPQQLHNAVKVDHRSDLYSLGAMMYTGERFWGNRRKHSELHTTIPSTARSLYTTTHRPGMHAATGKGSEQSPSKGRGLHCSTEWNCTSYQGRSLLYRVRNTGSTWLQILPQLRHRPYGSGKPLCKVPCVWKTSRSRSFVHHLWKAFRELRPSFVLHDGFSRRHYLPDPRRHIQCRPQRTLA